jgi:hypothetical protein
MLRTKFSGVNPVSVPTAIGYEKGRFRGKAKPLMSRSYGGFLRVRNPARPSRSIMRPELAAVVANEKWVATLCIDVLRSVVKGTAVRIP